MEDDDINPNTLRKFILYKIGVNIVLQGCPRKGGWGLSTIKKIVRSQKAAPLTSYPFSMCHLL